MPRYHDTVTTDADDLPRLSKRMGELGLCSRREAEQWIVAGWVKVDGHVVDVLGTRVRREARIEVDPRARAQQAELVTVILNKPIGYVSGQAEDGYEPATVLIRPENRWRGDASGRRFEPRHLEGLAPAGRLDIDSTGLMVYTQDGRIAKHLIGGNDVEKEYLVRVQGGLSAEGMARLRHGLTLDGLKLKPAQVSWQNADQLRFGLREGRKRQIRRMCEIVGLKVTGLKRIRTGRVLLGALPIGQWRYLGVGEAF
jgi:23S rRNA pseudouridine2604 synthase